VTQLFPKVFVWEDVANLMQFRKSRPSTAITTILRPFVWDYPGEPVPTHHAHHRPIFISFFHLSTIHSILRVQITCFAIFLHNLAPCPLWSTSWCGALHLIFHTFLHPISVFFSQHMPIPSQSVLLHTSAKQVAIVWACVAHSCLPISYDGDRLNRT